MNENTWLPSNQTLQRQAAGRIGLSPLVCCPLQVFSKQQLAQIGRKCLKLAAVVGANLNLPRKTSVAQRGRQSSVMAVESLNKVP